MGELADRLNESARAVTESAAEEERAALRHYHALDRTYELVNQVLRGERSPEDLDVQQLVVVEDIVAGLARLLRRWRTPEPIVTYRGLRRSDIDPTGGMTRTFLATTINRDVAIGEFTRPPGRGGSALLEIEVPAATPAIWVPPLGDPALAYQQELLLGRWLSLSVRASREEVGILVLNCEVQM